MSLQQLGWQPVFQQQLTLEDYDHSVIARITAHHRSGYTLASEQGEIVLPVHQNQPTMTVGDWVILNADLQLGEMMAILSIAVGMVGAIARLATTNIQLQEAKVAFDRMYEFAALKPEADNISESTKMGGGEIADYQRFIFPFCG